MQGDAAQFDSSSRWRSTNHKAIAFFHVRKAAGTTLRHFLYNVTRQQNLSFLQREGYLQLLILSFRGGDGARAEALEARGGPDAAAPARAGGGDAGARVVCNGARGTTRE